MRKNLLIFLGCVVVLLCAYRWGDVKFDAAKKVVLEKVYNGITSFMFPTIGIYEKAAGEVVYHDIQAMFLPALSTIGQNSVGTSNSSGKNNSELENSQKDSEEQESSQQESGQQGEVTESIKDTQTVTTPPEVDAFAGLIKQVTINRQKLKDVDYLRQNFYQVDNSTTIGKELLNVDKLLGKDLTIQSDVEGPQILIYHTHSQEGYKDSVAGDSNTSIVAVGEYLAELLQNTYHIEVLHHKGAYDVDDHAKAYSNALPAIQKILKDHPTIEVVIDLHRDGVAEKTHLVTQIDGKPTAQIMFFNGLSRTTAQGELTYLKNPYIEDNLAFSFQMQLAAEEYFPGLARKIYLKGYRYNMHMCAKTLLVEVGAQTNSFEEARNAMEPLAILLAKVLKTDKVP